MTHLQDRPGNNLRKSYTIFLQIGLIVTLTAFLVAFNIKMPAKQSSEKMTEEQEVVKMEEIVQTKHEKQPPPPPRPQVPQEVPNDEIVEDQILDISSEMNIDDKLELPPPPKQDEEADSEKVFVAVEQQAQLIGGLQSIQQKIKYPEMARRAGIEGRVYVQFIVNEEGKVESPEVVRGISGGCNEEALRVIRTAEFIPARQRGRKVKVKLTLPINFQLTNS